MNLRQRLFYAYGWVFVRPRRWLFRKLIWNYSARWLPDHDEYFGWKMPNIHWFVLYWTLFKFCKWLHYDAWRPFCKWEKGGLSHKPLIARIIQRIGQTTAGCAIHGGECFHCSSEDGDPVDLSNDETGKMFILEETGTSATPDGTDHWFRGTTICPRCGYKATYSDSSL